MSHVVPQIRSFNDHCPVAPKRQRLEKVWPAFLADRLIRRCSAASLLAFGIAYTVPVAAEEPALIEGFSLPGLSSISSYHELFLSSDHLTNTLTPLLRKTSGSLEEPFGSEDFASSGHAVRVPEPLLFDLVRPLGAKRGELEFNTLALFPWSATNTKKDEDQFGSGPTTRDRGGIEWAPEVEYAVADNFAIEFEFPFEDNVLEEYKLGLQWTLGTAFDNHYIHGFQMLIEPTYSWEEWSTTLLYLGGIRFDDTWSALFMFGGRMNLEGPNNSESFERLFNASLFADLNYFTSVGLETNHAAKSDGTSEFILVPQIHLELAKHWQIQTGLGFGVASEGSEQSAILRVIYSR